MSVQASSCQCKQRGYIAMSVQAMRIYLHVSTSNEDISSCQCKHRHVSASNAYTQTTAEFVNLICC